MAEITTEKEKTIKSARLDIEHLDVEKFCEYPDAKNFIEYRSITNFLEHSATLEAMEMPLAETYALLYKTSDTQFLSYLIAKSRETKETWEALILIAQNLLREGRPLPRELAEWVADVLADQLGNKKKPEKEKRRSRPPGGPWRLYTRDRILYLFVNYLIHEFDLKATRNTGDPPLSACDVVAAAIEGAALDWNLSPKAIEKIWSKRGSMKGPFYPH